MPPSVFPFGRCSVPVCALTNQNRLTKTPRGFRVDLRVLFYQEDDAIIAHCLEFDLMGDGPTHDDAMKTLVDAITIQIDESFRSGNPDNLFGPAPAEYFRMFAEGASTERASRALRLTMEATDDDKKDSQIITGITSREYVPNDLVMA